MVSGLSNLTFRAASQEIRSNGREKSVGFSAEKSEYHNPVNPTIEKAVACTGPVILSGLIGIGAFIGSKHVKVDAVKNNPKIIGGVAALITAILTIPGAIYNANVRARMKKEQYNPFEAEKKAETVLQRQLLEQAKGNPDDLSSNADIALKLGIAKNGGGAVIFPSLGK